MRILFFVTSAFSTMIGFTMTGTKNIDLYGMSNEHKLVGFVVCSIGLWALTRSLQFLILQWNAFFNLLHVCTVKPPPMLDIKFSCFSSSQVFIVFSNSHFHIYIVRYWIRMYFCYNLQPWEAWGSTTRQEICFISSNTNSRWYFIYRGRWKVKSKGSTKSCSFLDCLCLTRI